MTERQYVRRLAGAAIAGSVVAYALVTALNWSYVSTRCDGPWYPLRLVVPTCGHYTIGIW